MRILICDDEILITEQVKCLIQEYFSKKNLQSPELCCLSCSDSLLQDTGNKDIVFLDIEMPGSNGIYVGNELKKQNRDVIIFIISSHSEYLDDAMRFNVFRYLSKPIDKHRLFRNLDDALTLYHTLSLSVPIETKQGVTMITTTSIVTVETQSRKTIIHSTAGDFESTQTMQYWISVLPHNCFFQTHRSFLVNFAHVSKFNHSMVYMDEGKFYAYLTRRKYTAFKESYLLYLESTR